MGEDRVDFWPGREVGIGFQESQDLLFVRAQWTHRHHRKQGSKTFLGCSFSAVDRAIAELSFDGQELAGNKQATVEKQFAGS
jgi:hypothetical protein